MLRGPRADLVLASLRHTGTASPEQARDRRSALLRRLIQHAYSRVPYYRELFDRHRIRPGEIRSEADLPRVPTTTKEDLRHQPLERVTASGLDRARLIPRSTSGSDGRSFMVYRTWLEQNLLQLFRLRAQLGIGLRLSDRMVTLGILRSQHRADRKWVGRTLGALGVYRRRRLDVFAAPDSLMADLRRLRPDVLAGYPGVLSVLAQRTRGQPPPGFSPRILLSGAEVLTPLLRRTIEDGFGVPVFDMYGCHEINLVAWECPGGGGLHTCDDAAVVEVLCGPRRAGEGERGEVVVTGLHSYAMPFIRYRLGDIAVRGDDACRCGRPLGTIRAIEGRTFEHFQLPDGRVIHPHRIGRLLLDFPAVSRYQITQERPDLVVVRVVPGWGKDLDPAALDRPIRALLGPDVHLQVLTVRDIPPERTGKVQIYRSLASVVRDVSP